jgi:uncharacterized protein (DUF2342 family)
VGKDKKKKKRRRHHVPPAEHYYRTTIGFHPVRRRFRHPRAVVSVHGSYIHIYRW